jgi:hypothetical protein
MAHFSWIFGWWPNLHSKAVEEQGDEFLWNTPHFFWRIIDHLEQSVCQLMHRLPTHDCVASG